MYVFSRCRNRLEPQVLRRRMHWRAAFEVASLDNMEARLKRFGVEYHKFMVPGTNAAQIFLWDPEGCAALFPE